MTARRAGAAHARESTLEAPTATKGAKAVSEAAGLFRQTERAFMASVMRYARLMGWRAYHTHDSRRSDAGFPDLVLIRRPRVVWAELKSDRGRLTDAQWAWIDDLIACGQEVYLWRPSSWEDIERVLTLEHAGRPAGEVSDAD